MEASYPPSKRLKSSSPSRDAMAFSSDANYVSLDHDDGNANSQFAGSAPLNTPSGPQIQSHGHANGRNDRNDRPRKRFALPGFEPWILIKTKLGRRFVHNSHTKESFWRIPKDVRPGVEAYDLDEEKRQNARWAETQLTKMRGGSGGVTETEEVASKSTDHDGRSRRRRSESLQKEDEEVMLAELAAEAERAEEKDAEAAAKAVAPLEPRGFVGEASDSEYEYVEVTDDEGEEAADVHPDTTEAEDASADLTREEPQGVDEEGPVEFGEDDMAYQLAMMGESYGLDPGEYAAGESEEEVEYEEGTEGLAISAEDATSLFSELLDDHNISPFTPWDKVIADESETSIVLDDRYTVLPSMRARKAAWENWSREKASAIKAQRALEERKDPRIAYLAFLEEKATPKLYWPEFKRRVKREPELNDRSMQEKDREKLYRELIAKMKTPESKRKDDLRTLLKSLPLKDLNRDTSLDALPLQLLTNVVYYALPTTSREAFLKAHISSLPAAPASGGTIEELAARDRQRKRDAALAERERKVDEEQWQSQKNKFRARADLKESERELQAAMNVKRNGLKGML